MDIDVKEQAVQQVFINAMNIDNLSMIEAIKNLFITNLFYYKIVPDREEKELVKKQLWILVNKWLEIMSPIKHVDGLAVEVGENISKKIWDIDTISIEAFEDLLVNTYLLREYTFDRNVLDNILERVKTHISMLIKVLGGDPDKGLVGSILRNNKDVEELVSLTSLLLVVSTNI